MIAFVFSPTNFKGDWGVIDKEFKYGVYVKLNGKLVSLEKGDNFKYHVIDGRKSKNKLLNALYKAQGLNAPYMGWESNSIAWGPTSYMNYCKYLGEL